MFWLVLPCLYLQATQDRMVPECSAALIQSVLPSTKVVEINGPHCLLQVTPVEAVAAISTFVHEVQLAL